MDLQLLMFLHLVFFFTLTYASPQAKYFINCGSSDNATLGDSRVFVGDVKPVAFHLQSHHSEIAKDSTHPSDNMSSLYTTARVFSKTSTYVFDIPTNGTYILRFHFYAFASSPSLGEAQFDVSAPGHMLLPQFSMGKKGTDSLIIKEFFIDISTAGEFRVHFSPNPVAPTVAFVNAIELLCLLSTSLNITEDSGKNITPAGVLGVNKVQKSDVLETVYRINVGGSEVTSSEDTLWRTWEPDDQYLVDKNAAENSPVSTDAIMYGYRPGVATVDDAPKPVYRTAKMLKGSEATNLTWKFNNVSKGAKHLVRVHFCDIMQSITNVLFNLYFYGKFVEEVNPSVITQYTESAAPFYKDYIVDSESFEFINISLRAVNDGYLFLNGLEIMQLRNGTAPDNIYHSKRLRLIVGLAVASVAAVIVIALLIAVVWFRVKRKKEESVEASEWGMIHMNGASSNNRSSERSSLQASTLRNLNLGLKLPFADIQKVTNNFDAGLIIGEGGFGKVYKGVLGNGLKVAVKRSSPDHGQGLAEFQTEIMILSKIRHRHLVSLIGYCYEGEEMILVYEFMEKGTLREHLYESRGIDTSSNRLSLSWEQRLDICIGSAIGLHYLHTGAEGGIIHRDVKSTNILLDERYVAKVADFGLSRFGDPENSFVSTNVKGTFGYLDPEYYQCMQLTEKSDVYSFGVVLFEVLCARPVLDRSLPNEQKNLAEWGMTCLEQGKLEDIIDPSIIGEITQNSLKKFAETAAKCLKESSVDRPPMSDVIWDLEYALKLQRAATAGLHPGDSMTMTDASLNLALPADPLYSFQSITDMRDDDVTLTATGEVFSQLKFDDDTGR